MTATKNVDNASRFALYLRSNEMTPLSTLTKRDRDLLRCLSLRIQFATGPQIAREWWPNSKEACDLARRRLQRLHQLDLVRAVRIAVPSPRILSFPLCVWQPGDAIPNLGGLAWILNGRAAELVESLTLWRSASAVARCFGGLRQVSIKRPFQIAHDLGVAEMFFAVRRRRPQLAELWIDETRLAKQRRHQKLPDAVIASRPDATPQLVLEYGGVYNKQRLLDFHEDNRDRGLPYEIW